MHRHTARPRWIWGIVLVLLANVPCFGQGKDPNRGAVVVPVNGTVRLQMSSKKPISTVNNPKENVLRIRTVLGDPTSVLLIGQQPGMTRVEMTDADDNKEVFEIIVQADVEYLKTQLRRVIGSGQIVPIPTSNNAVVLQGTVMRPEDANLAVNIARSVGFTPINALRVGGVQQVQLDVVVATVSRSEFRRMAFNFLTNAENFFLASTVGQAVANPVTVGAGGILSNAPGGLLAIPGAPNGSPTNVLFGVLHDDWGFLGFLQALRDENVLKLMAEPRLVTVSGRPASFLVGGEQAIPIVGAVGTTGVDFRPFGTQLDFLPIVLGNGKIHLEVRPEISNLDPASGTSIGGTVVPGRVTNRVETTVELESGQTFVIGGLIQHQVLASVSKTPILGELPYLSALFSSKSFQETEQEVLILVTPYLIDGQSCAQRPKVLPGQETRSPDDFELFLESILEAPRGQRVVRHGRGYKAAYKNSPSAAVYPCGNGAECGTGECSPTGCETGVGPVGHQTVVPQGSAEDWVGGGHAVPAEAPAPVAPAAPGPASVPHLPAGEGHPQPVAPVAPGTMPPALPSGS